MLRLYVQVRGVSSMSVSVLGGIQDGSFDVEGAGFRIAAAENEDQVLAAERLRHELPSLAGLGVAGEGSFHQRRRVELGFHGFHQVFSGVLRAAQARLFFFDFADFTVDLVALGIWKGIEEFLKAFGLAEFAGEDGMDGSRIRHKADFPRALRGIDANYASMPARGRDILYLNHASYSTALHSDHCRCLSFVDGATGRSSKRPDQRE